MAANSALLKKETSKFQEMLTCLYAAVYTEKSTTVHYRWSGNVVKVSEMYSFLCQPLIMAFCLALSGLF